jgi:tetratricopeptide (TPR) repeat protein
VTPPPDRGPAPRTRWAPVPSHRASAWIVFGIALAVRLVFLLQLHAHSPTYETPEGGDSILYDRLAQGAADPRAYFHSPLYIGWLSTLYAAVGRNLTIVRVAQHVLGAATAALVTLVAWKLTRNRMASLVTGIVVACLARPVFVEGHLLVDALLPFLLVTGGLLALRVSRHPRMGTALVLGLVLGIGALGRASVLVWWPVLAGMWLTRLARSQEPRRRRTWASAIAGLTLGITGAIAPVTVRNVVVERDWVPITANAGLNLYVGNNPRANGGYSLPDGLWFRPGDPEDDFRGQRAAESALGRPLKSSEISAWWTYRAVAFVRANPGRALELAARRVGILVANEEFEQLYNLGSYSTFCPVLGFLLPAAAVLILGLVGLVLGLTRGGQRRLWAVLVIAQAAAFVPFFVVDRYRMPWLVLLAPLQAVALAFLARAFRHRARYRIVGFGLATAATAILCFANRSYPSNAWWQLTAFGDARLAQGRPRDAVVWYERAIGIDGSMLWARMNLAVALMRLGEWDAAATNLRAAKDRWPTDARVENQLGVLELRRHRPALAEAHLRTAIGLDPTLGEAHANLVEALVASSRSDDALSAFEEARAARLLSKPLEQRLRVLLFPKERSPK